MKTIASWQDLEPFGVVFLTAESCGLSYRYLCDLTARGRKTLIRMLGIPEISLPAPWNAGSESNPHIASVLFAPCMLEPLGAFALLESGAKEAWIMKNGTVIGVFPGDTADEIALIEKFCSGQLCRKLRVAGTASDRNLHMASGRVD